MLQLLDINVSVIRSLKEDVEYTPDVFQREFDMSTSQFIDYLSIMGDASDNIPGVRGIGPKGAKKLIDEFGSVEEILSRTADIKNPRMRELVETNIEMLKLSQQLVIINRSMEIPVDYAHTRYPQFNQHDVQVFFSRFDFMSLLRMIPKSTVVQPVQNTVQASLFDEPVTVQDDRSIMEDNSFSVWIQDGRIDVYSLAEQKALASDKLPQIIEDRKAIIVTYDAHDFLKRFPGCKAQLRDIRLFEYWHGYSSVCDSQAQFALKYGVNEARSLNNAYVTFARFIKEENLWDHMITVEHALLPVLAEMEQYGIAIDETLLSSYEQELTGISDLHESQVYRLCGSEFNIRSPKQLAQMLFETMKIEPPGGVKKNKTGFSTDEDVLASVALVHPVGAHLLDYRKTQKILSTYIMPYKEVIQAGRLHTTFDYCGTATGRLSSQSPNLQNIPIHGEWGDKMRTLFTAPAGKKIISVDYSQMELRVLAHFSGDKALIDVFNNDLDIHSETARQIFGSAGPSERSHAKAINFGIVYGQSPFGLAEQLGIPQHAARDYIKKYFERFKGVRDFIEYVKQQSRDKGFVSVLSGRRRYVNGITSNNRMIREAAERVAVNTPIQGSAADIIKTAMIKLYRQLQGKNDIRMVLQVHDELLFEVDAEKAAVYMPVIKAVMEEPVYGITVPMTVSIKAGNDWREAH